MLTSCHHHHYHIITILIIIILVVILIIVIVLLIIIASWKDYVAYCDEHCCFTDTHIDNDLVFVLNDHICGQLKKHGLENLVVEVCKFALPTSDGVPHLLSSKASGFKKIKQLFVPLKNSRSFELSKKMEKPSENRAPLFGASIAATRPEESDNDDDTQQGTEDATPPRSSERKRQKVIKKGKGKASGKGRAKAKGAKPKQPSPQAPRAHVSETAVFLEDAQNMLESTLSTVDDSKIDKEVTSKAMSKIIEFGLEGDRLNHNVAEGNRCALEPQSRSQNTTL